MVLNTSVTRHLGQTLSNKAIAAHCLDPPPGMVCLSVSPFPDISVVTCHFGGLVHEKNTCACTQTHWQQQYTSRINTECIHPHSRRNTSPRVFARTPTQRTS